jgi:hypothetical protein
VDERSERYQRAKKDLLRRSGVLTERMAACAVLETKRDVEDALATAKAAIAETEEEILQIRATMRGILDEGGGST